MQKYKIFPNLFTCPVSKRHIAIFHPFQFRTAYLSVQDYDFIKSELLAGYSNNLFKKLIKYKFIVREIFDYDKFILKEKQKYYAKIHSSISVIYFILSESCNLSCKYCFLKTSKRISSSKKFMSSQEGMDAVFFLLKHISLDDSNPLRVIFYGGEPLLNFSTLRIVTFLLRKLEQKGKFGKRQVDISLVTNGTLITKEMASFFAYNKVKVGISLDGFPLQHNQARYIDKNMGSFSKAIKGYRLVKNTGATVSTSITIGSHNVDSLPRIVNYFAKKLKPSGVGFNIMKDSYFIKNPCQISMDNLGRVIFRAYEILRKYSIYEDRVGRYVNAIRNKRMSNFCTGYGKQLVFLPGGDILPCHAFFPIRKYKIGNIYEDSDGSLFENPIFKLWASRTSLAIPKCKYCPAILLCSGGCAQEVEVKGGSFWDIDERMCSFFKMFLEWHVKDKYKETIKSIDNKGYLFL